MHQPAREFLESYAQSLEGRERAWPDIECLWHEAEALSLSEDAGKAELLMALAGRLSRDLTGTAGAGTGGVMVPSFRERELRDFSAAGCATTRNWSARSVTGACSRQSARS